ncbi:MAG: hypothetical protein J6S71_01720 [Clostridia bacterium]|nr:hypothetical protein [Clostridia bacterium]
MKKILALILAVFMLLPAAVACSETQDPGTETENNSASTTAPVADEGTEDLYDEDGFLKSDLPELDFGGETVTVLYWSDVEMQEYEAEEINSILVNDAIYRRNANVEKTLNIEFEWLSTPGNNGKTNEFVTYVGNIYSGGDTNLDLISAYSRTTAICAIEGYCADMADLPYLNFDMPWWPASLLDVVSIGDSVYFASGDASVNVLHLMYAIYFNKDLIEEYKLENPIELVRNDQWTLDKLIEMTKDSYQDLDANGKEDVNDFFGLVGASWGFDAFYTGSDLRLVEQDADKLLVISEDFYGQKAVDLCTKLGQWNQTGDCYIDDSYHQDPFVEGRSIFIQDRCHLADKRLVGLVDFTYSIVPTPLYNADQEDFISVVGNPFSLYALFSASEDLDRAAAVLECWASEAYRTTTPAQFEMNMKLRYSESSDEADMYNIIRNTVCFDLGRLFNNRLNKITDIFYKAAIENQNFAMISKAQSRALNHGIEGVVEAFKELTE